MAGGELDSLLLTRIMGPDGKPLELMGYPVYASDLTSTRSRGFTRTGTVAVTTDRDENMASGNIENIAQLPEAVAPGSVYQLLVPENFRMTQREADMIGRSWRSQFPGSQLLVNPPGFKIVPLEEGAAVRRLTYLLGLSDDVRSFVLRLAFDPGNKETLGVFADWLEEQNSPESGRIRKMAEGE